MHLKNRIATLLASLVLCASLDVQAQPTVVSTNPPPGAVLEDLYIVNVIFDQSVKGVRTNSLQMNLSLIHI